MNSILAKVTLLIPLPTNILKSAVHTGSFPKQIVGTFGIPSTSHKVTGQLESAEHQQGGLQGHRICHHPSCRIKSLFAFVLHSHSIHRASKLLGNSLVSRGPTRDATWVTQVSSCKVSRETPAIQVMKGLQFPIPLLIARTGKGPGD